MDCYGYKLKPHQEMFMRRAQKENILYLATDPGTGKSFVARLFALQQVRIYKRKVLIVVSAGELMREWANNLDKDGGYKKHDIIYLEAGRHKSQWMDRAKENPLNNKHFAICSYNFFQNPENVDNLNKLFKPDIIIMDEAHNLKAVPNKRAQTGKRAQALYKYVNKQKIQRRYMMSATPIPNDYKDLFQQYLILDNGVRLTKLFTYFRDIYFVDANRHWSHKEAHFPKFQLRAGAMEAINRKVKDITIRGDREEILDLPDLIVKNVKVDMNERQAKAYKTIKERGKVELAELHAQLKAKKIERTLYISTVLGVMAKLRQVVSCFVYYDDIVRGEIRQKAMIIGDAPKIKLLAKLLKTFTGKHKVIVWCCFRTSYKIISRVCTKLGIKHSILVGGMTKNQRAKNIDAFKEGDSMVLIANPESAGEGINLAMSRVSIYYDRNYSYKSDFQSEARNYRHGSTQSVYRFNLITKKSIDEEIADNIKDKTKLVSAFNKYIRGI